MTGAQYNSIQVDFNNFTKTLAEELGIPLSQLQKTNIQTLHKLLFFMKSCMFDVYPDHSCSSFYLAQSCCNTIIDAIIAAIVGQDYVSIIAARGSLELIAKSLALETASTANNKFSNNIDVAFKAAKKNYKSELRVQKKALSSQINTITEIGKQNYWNLSDYVHVRKEDTLTTGDFLEEIFHYRGGISPEVTDLLKQTLQSILVLILTCNSNNLLHNAISTFKLELVLPILPNQLKTFYDFIIKNYPN